MEKMEYKLDVDNARVHVFQWHKYWMWSFAWNDGSCSVSDSDYCATERGAKEWAKVRYQVRTGKRIKRAKWIRVRG